jgi:uncharacterized protein YbjT (DUF2867 family)
MERHVIGQARLATAPRLGHSARMDTKFVTVIGGSGFIGRYVVQQLVDAGLRVRVAVRNPNLALFLKPLGRVGQVQLCQANLRNRASVEAAVAGADAVINLVGLLYESGPQSFEDVQRDGAILAAECAAAAGATQFVQLSAIGADAQSDSAYARSKAEAEAGVRKVFPAATILRPSIVFGPEDGFFNRFAAMAKWPMPVMPVVAGDTRFQPVYVKDVAACVLQAVVNNTHAGKTYELGGPGTYSFRALTKMILDEIMVSKPLIDVPMPIAKIQAMVLGLAPKPLVTSDQLKLLAKDNVVGAGARTIADFGITPTPVEAIVPSYLVRFRPKGQFSRKPQA